MDKIIRNYGLRWLLQSDSFYFIFSQLAQAAKALTLSGATKDPSVKCFAFASSPFRGAESKSPFCAIGPKVVIITLSVIIPFLLSASWQMFSHISASRKAHINPRRSTLLSPSLVNRLPRFAVPTLYKVTTRQSLVAVMCFSLVLMG